MLSVFDKSKCNSIAQATFCTILFSGCMELFREICFIVDLRFFFVATARLCVLYTAAFQYTMGGTVSERVIRPVWPLLNPNRSGFYIYR